MLELVVTLVLFLAIEMVSENILLRFCLKVFKSASIANIIPIFAMLVLITLIIICLLILVQYRWQPPLFKVVGRQIGNKNILSSATFYKSLAIVLICIFISSFLMSLIPDNHGRISVAQQTSLKNLTASLPIRIDTLMSSLIYSPLIEEIFFRYGMFWISNQFLVLTSNDWKRGIDTTPMVLFLSAAISNIFFATIHLALSFSSFMIYWTMGMAFSFMYIKYRSLWASIITHICWNTLVVLVILV
ncbi:CPBP family intramembrane metalloprotease [Limosilactobacillus reuteri]|nr:CPBP family intramembrane metalloprotease [Limosilactobacillus reuteri]